MPTISDGRCPPKRRIWRSTARGSLLLPPKLRHDARLEREALVIGVQGHLEFWSPDGWATVTERLNADAKAIVEQLTAPI